MGARAPCNLARAARAPMSRSMRALALLLLSTAPAAAWTFESIDGGPLTLSGPALVVNTASLCAFTPQYEALQALHDDYADRGLTVLAVPSDAFRQELASDAAVAEFCDAAFGLTLPMTTITDITGRDAHPFYAWLADDHGVAPRWNFDKALIDASGALVAFERSRTPPDALRPLIEALLPE